MANNLIQEIYKAGQYICKEGEFGICMYIIKEGEVECVKGDKVVRVLKQGDNFGQKALNLFDKYIELFEINNQIKFIPLTEKIKFYVDLIEKNKAASTLVQAYKIKIKELSNKENIKEYLSSYTANIDKLDIISIKNTYPWKINNETIKPLQKIKHIEYINRMMKFLNFTIDSLWNKSPDKNIDIIR